MVSNYIKSKLKNNTQINNIVQFIRSGSQEVEYLKLRDYYYQANPKLLQNVTSGIKSSYTEFLDKSEDICIFLIVSHDWEHRTLIPDLQKNFKLHVFDYCDFMKCFYKYPHNMEWRRDLQQQLLNEYFEYHRQNRVDIVFAYGSFIHFERDTLENIRSTGVPVALMWLDDKHTFLPNNRLSYPNGQKPLIGSVDIHLTNSLECTRWYIAEGEKVYYFPEGCTINNDTEVVEKLYDVSFVGKNYGARSKFIETLSRNGIRVECFGQGWTNGPLSDDKINTIYQQSWINIGIGGVRYSNKITCLKGRDFDIPATGSAYLTTYDPELAHMFVIGSEVLCYRNEIDAVEQIRYYLENKDLLIKIGKLGKSRCKKEHTWTIRLLELLSFMKIII